jgi:uncharacterized protein with PIN domain
MSRNDEPEMIDCFFCGGRMEKKYRVETARFVRVLWHCTKCAREYWKSYGAITLESKRERKRWH